MHTCGVHRAVTVAELLCSMAEAPGVCDQHCCIDIGVERLQVYGQSHEAAFLAVPNGSWKSVRYLWPPQAWMDY